MKAERRTHLMPLGIQQSSLATTVITSLMHQRQKQRWDSTVRQFTSVNCQYTLRQFTSVNCLTVPSLFLTLMQLRLISSAPHLTSEMDKIIVF